MVDFNTSEQELLLRDPTTNASLAAKPIGLFIRTLINAGTFKGRFNEPLNTDFSDAVAVDALDKSLLAYNPLIDAAVWFNGTGWVLANFDIMFGKRDIPNISALQVAPIRVSYKLAALNTLGDNGGGEFIWHPGSTLPADNAIVVASDVDPSGRWIREHGQVIKASWWGIVGDGSEETDKLNALFAYAATECYTVRFKRNLTLGWSEQANAADDLKIENCNVEWKGSTLAKLGGRDDRTEYNFTIGSNVVSDRMRITLPFDTIQKGLLIDGDNIDIEGIRVEGAAPGTGRFGNTNVGLKIGGGVTRRENIQIGALYITNIDRPYMTDLVDNVEIRVMNCTGMLRGIYCRDTRYSKFLGGRLTGGSPNVVGHPGENAILIESDVADYSSEGLLFKSIYSDRSGEHGFRVGGQNIVRDVLHVGCTSKRHGSGLIPGEIEDGGSGFKVLGPTSRDNIYHSNISYDNCSAVSANCLLYTSPSPRDQRGSRMPSSA